MHIDETYIISYIKGELSDKERRAFEYRISLSPELRQKTLDTAKLWHLSENWQKQQKVDSKAAWKRLSRKITRPAFKRRLWNTSRTAAAILLPLFLIYHYVFTPLLESQRYEETVTVTSVPGMVVKTILPDGSEVWLNAQSTLTYPSRFTKKKRTVNLAGEAYFKVTSDKKNRFTVITPKGMTVSAYGTEFNVNAHPTDTCHEVTLARGNVDISSDKALTHISLNAGEKALFHTSNRTMHKQPADTYVETSWKDGKMVFRRQRLDYIADKLSRKYGATIVLEGDKLKDYIYTATFTDESLEDILDLLKRSAPIDYTVSKPRQRNNHTYTQRKVIIKNIE